MSDFSKESLGSDRGRSRTLTPWFSQHLLFCLKSLKGSPAKVRILSPEVRNHQTSFPGVEKGHTHGERTGDHGVVRARDAYQGGRAERNCVS